MVLIHDRMRIILGEYGRIALLLPRDYQLLSVAYLLEVFVTLERFNVQDRVHKTFVLHLVQSTDQVTIHNKSFHGYTIKSIRSNIKPNIVLIPAFSSERINESVKENRSLVHWIQSQYKSGAEIASFCTGTFLLAATGLLNGKLATTHVNECANLILSFPSVFVKPGRTLTVDGRCYTSGGSLSSFHLLIFLIQKHFGKDNALRIAKTFGIELDRHQQSYFSTFRPDYSHSDEMVKRIQKKIGAEYKKITTIEEVIKELPASRRNIVRRFKQFTGVPPIEYLQHTRIEAAKKLLEQTNQSVSQIINQTGYLDPKSFRKIFLKLVGITPMEYRNKFKIK